MERSTPEVLSNEKRATVLSLLKVVGYGDDVVVPQAAERLRLHPHPLDEPRRRRPRLLVEDAAEVALGQRRRLASALPSLLVVGAFLVFAAGAGRPKQGAN